MKNEGDGAGKKAGMGGEGRRSAAEYRVKPWTPCAPVPPPGRASHANGQIRKTFRQCRASLRSNIYNMRVSKNGGQHKHGKCDGMPQNAGPYSRPTAFETRNKKYLQSAHGSAGNRAIGNDCGVSHYAKFERFYLFIDKIFKRESLNCGMSAIGNFRFLRTCAIAFAAQTAFATEGFCAEVKGERLFDILGFPVTNSMFTTWIFEFEIGRAHV